MAEIKTPKKFNHLLSISSLDGRFRGRVENYSEYFSEYATIKGRLYVEIEYLIAFLREIKKPATKKEKSLLKKIYLNFDVNEAKKVWEIDKKINHDTKAVEIYLGKKLKSLKLTKFINFLHFGITSTDVDNTALALSIKSFMQEQYIKSVESLINELKVLSRKQANLVMPARTHGKIAVPTTAGKELANYSVRLSTHLKKIKKIEIGSKMTGAVGNYNAHYAAYPDKNWEKFSENFLHTLKLKSYPMTTQVEPYEHKIELFQAIKRINNIVIALDTDIWRYLALGYLSLRDSKGHVGSSTMPQKINPIGFEMSESYLYLANAIFNVLENKLPTNRWQRDLTDKYLLRELGQAMVQTSLAYESTTEGLAQIGFNKAFIQKDLDEHWEIIAEGVQTILRTTNYPDPYGALKNLTRGKKVTRESYEKFISELNVSEDVKKKLKNLSPQTYTGIANKLAKRS